MENPSYKGNETFLQQLRKQPNDDPRVPPSQLPSNPQREHRFAAKDWNVWQGSRRICVCASRNMAMRIANALNAYTPNKTGR